jgi:CxxC-x17-CxxC domain-containing protein
MHTTTCAACGVETQVPFRPSGDRPVYCRDCFTSNNNRR